MLCCLDLAFTLLLLIAPLPKIDQFADRRHSRRRNFYQVDTTLLRELHRFLWRHHAYRTIVVNDADLRNADLLIQTYTGILDRHFTAEPTLPAAWRPGCWSS